jgi:site-specific DNA recombinase
MSKGERQRIVPRLDRWLARLFEPEHIRQTLDAKADVRRLPSLDEQVAARREIADADRKLARYRAALEADADPAAVAGWIKDAQADRAAAGARYRRAGPAATRQLTRDELEELIERLGEMVGLLADDADPARKPRCTAALDFG